MPRAIIFDLSEVLNAGLVGIEKVLDQELPVAEQDLRTFFSYEFQKTKKDQATFLEVLHQTACAPEDCLFIDDNPKNVAVAESVGITGIRFVDAAQLRVALNRHLS